VLVVCAQIIPTPFLQVQEIEQNAPDQQYGKTNASVDVTVEITDENDNMPEFENATYTAEVQENTQPNVPITLLDPTQIMVFDHDQVFLKI